MTDTLTTWLTAILDEDEETARASLGVGEGGPAFASLWNWMLADIAAKRALIEHCIRLQKRAAHVLTTEADILAAQAVNWAVHTLASAYSDRPGYQEAWRP